MDAIESILRSYAWNLRYAEALVAGLTPELWTRPAEPGLPNHPAWTIGHLCTGSNLVALGLGESTTFPDAWRGRFERRGPGDPRRPDPDPSVYPAADELMAAFRRLHATVDRAVRAAPRERLGADVEWRFCAELPTEGDALLFMLVTHEALHLGQLEAWRRAQNLGSALAKL